MTQGELLERLIWPQMRDVAAIGCVALVELRRQDVHGALICANVANGATELLAARHTNDPRLRARYFDLDPLAHLPEFQAGYAWLVATSINTDGGKGLSEVGVRFGAGRADTTNHCHLVIPPATPDSWQEPEWSDWETLNAERYVDLGVQWG
jgi:hypothetical protein